MKSIHKKYFATVALTWASCLVLCFVVYMLVMVPQQERKKQIEKDVAEAKRKYRSTVKAVQKDTDIHLSKEIENLRNQLRQFVIDFDDSANLTFDISRIATENKVTSVTIRSKGSDGFLAMPNCKYLCEHHINVGFTAGFNQFASFLNALERNHPVVFVDEFAITRSEQGDSDHQAFLNIVVCVSKGHDS